MPAENAVAFSKRLLPHILFLVSLSIIISCGPNPPKPDLLNKIPPVPADLKIESAVNGKAILSWSVDRTANMPIGGYNIYLSDKPDHFDNPYNNVPFPGDTDGDPTHESIELTGLTNGRTFYATVRTILPGGAVTRPAQAVLFVPLETGQIELGRYPSGGDRSGYSFAKSKYVPAKNFENDIYFFATPNRAGISSPSLLYPGLRKTGIAFEMANDNSKIKYADSQPLQVGKCYIIRTAEKESVYLKLTRIKGEYPNLAAIFEYIYKPNGSSK